MRKKKTHREEQTYDFKKSQQTTQHLNKRSVYSGTFECDNKYMNTRPTSNVCCTKHAHTEHQNQLHLSEKNEETFCSMRPGWSLLRCKRLSVGVAEYVFSNVEGFGRFSLKQSCGWINSRVALHAVQCAFFGVTLKSP